MHAAAQRVRMERFDMLSKVLVLLFFAAIIYNLGAGLYFMMTDKGGSDRTLKALTRRIGLSVVLILLVIIGIWSGLIKPHGIGQ
jgi:succinate dehydrogenase/fumarate reductase cytochrome b subunit